MWVLSNIEDCVEDFLVGALTLNRIEILEQLDLFSILMFSVQIDIPKLCPLLEEVSSLFDDFSTVEVEVDSRNEDTGQEN